MFTSQTVQKLRDFRKDCDSILIEVSIGDFLALIDSVYDAKGGIEGQRSALKTKTAKSIRKRLVDDLKQGAIVPPIVVGVLAEAGTRADLWEQSSAHDFFAEIKGLEANKLSIIDGMQRTTALIEASQTKPELGNEAVRVEFWISEQIGGLIYRMLVLNTGQIPWEISRQLETVYSQLLSIIQDKSKEGAELFLKDDARRRTGAGQYHASTIVRLYLAFSSRRAEFDIRDKVAEDFARLDTIESSSHDEFLDYFILTFDLMVALDRAFSAGVVASKPHKVRIADGREIFQTEPAMIGFFVAMAFWLFDEPGFDIDWAQTGDRMQSAANSISTLVERVTRMNADELTEFLQLETLNDRLDQRSGQVGRFERDLFTRAFGLMLQRGHELKNLTPCWLR